MDPITASLIATGINALMQIWANYKNKPAGWTPSQQDWDDLAAEAGVKNFDWYKKNPPDA